MSGFVVFENIANCFQTMEIIEKNPINLCVFNLVVHETFELGLKFYDVECVMQENILVTIRKTEIIGIRRSAMSRILSSLVTYVKRREPEGFTYP